MARCEVCFRHCEIEEGKKGFCRARTCVEGEVVPFNHGRITSLALDPIEKKPLRRFFPGSKIISIGSFGCNLRCPFCQNNEISWSEEVEGFAKSAPYVSPEELLAIAKKYVNRGSIGVAYTYNEPLVGYEYVRDCARLVHEAGLKNVLVSNGTAELHVLKEILPYIDAMNVDIKSMSDTTYKDFLKGDLNTTKAFIERAAKDCHVELTMLIVPGMNDTEDEMRELSSWISGLTDKKGSIIGETIPLHISRFFPRYKMSGTPPTDVGKIYDLADVAREKLKYVYTGNC